MGAAILRLWLCTVAFAGAAQGIAAPAFAPSGVEKVQRLSPGERQERRFLQDAAAQLRFEHEAARIALAKSQNAAVREIASQIVRQHKASEPTLVRLLHVRGMAMPLVPNEHIKVMKQLQRADGRRFDRLFLEEVALRAHGVEVREHERLLQAQVDPAVRSWAEARLPGLRMRLAMAERAVPQGDRLIRAGLTGPSTR